MLQFIKIVSLILLLSINNKVYSQWYVSFTPPGPAQTSYTLKFYDQNTGWMTTVLYNSSTMNIYKTTNAGVSWVAQSSGFTSQRFMSIWIVDANTVYMSGNYGRIIKTTNGGNSWDSLKTYVNNQLWGIQFVDANTGYVCGSSGLIMKTTNAGLNWFSQSSGVMNAFSALYFTSPTTGYVCGSPLVLKTTNGGNNWVNCNAPFINPFENFRKIKFTDANTGYYVSDIGRIGKTTDAGQNWSILPTGTTETLESIYFTMNDTAYVCGNAGSIIKSTNAGVSWRSQTSGLNEILTDVCFTNASTGYISTWSGRVLKTTNGGGTFSNVSFYVNEKSFMLNQNYPNPFRYKTTITYNIFNEGLTKLIIYDINGNMISTIVNNIQQAGEYEVKFDASNLKAGLYYYKLTNNQQTETKRMVLIK